MRFPATFDLVGVVLLTIALMSPVLISPQWGLYSDAGQILTDPSIVLESFPDSLEKLLPESTGRWKPFYLLTNTVMYAVFGEQPLAWFTMLSVFLCVVMVLVFRLALVLTEKRSLAWFAVFLALTGSPIFETFYTLDKMEPHVGLASLLAFTWCTASIMRDGGRVVSARWILPMFIGQLILALIANFSKETGVFLVPVSATMALLFCFWKGYSFSPAVRASVIIFFSTQLVAFLAFKILYRVLADEVNHRYTTFELTPDLVWQNFLHYLEHMPEVIVTMALFLVWCSLFGIKLFSGKKFDSRSIIFAGVGLAGCAYLAGILLWRSAFVYLVFPAIPFMAITAAVLVQKLIHFAPSSFPIGVRRGVITAVFLIFVFIYLPDRFYAGGAIYAHDRAKDLLVKEIHSDMEPGQRYCFALFHPDSDEICERVTFFLERFNPDAPPVLPYSFFEGPWTNWSDKDRFEGSFGRTPSKRQLSELMDTPETFIMWRLQSKRWTQSPLRPGDVVLLPVGSSRNGSISARGVPLYSADSLTYQSHFPELQLKLRFSAHARIGWLTGGHLGWEGFEVLRIVTDIFPRGFDVRLGENWYDFEYYAGERFRWVGNDATIIVDQSRDRERRTLLLEVEGGPGTGYEPFTLTLEDASGRKIGEQIIEKRGVVPFTLPETASEEKSLYRFRVDGGGLAIADDPRVLNFRVFSVSWK